MSRTRNWWASVVLLAVVALQTGCFAAALTFSCATFILLDPAGHGPFILLPGLISLVFRELSGQPGLQRDSQSQATGPDLWEVTGPAPWVRVSGELTPTLSSSIALNSSGSDNDWPPRRHG